VPLLIEVEKLRKNFGSRAILRGIDFQAAAGEFVALAGPNGAGKTTFLRILSTLSRPTTGQIRIAGYHLPRQAASSRACLGYISHQPLLYGELTAEENLRFYGRLYGVTGLPKRIAEVLELVGLSRRASEPVQRFSRGMQQRLAIGRAILHNPRILLLDEPYTGLDVDAGQRLEGILREMIKQGLTIIMTTHDIQHAVQFAQRLDVLAAGKISASRLVGDSSPAEMLEFYLGAIRGSG
jgi:heme exporter protein A